MDNCQDFPHSFVKGADVRTKPELYAEGSEMLFFPSKKAFFLPSKYVLFLASILFIYRKCNSLQSTLQLKLDLWLFFSLSWRTKNDTLYQFQPGNFQLLKKVIMSFRYTFSSKHIFIKSSCGLCFWAEDTLIHRLCYNL